MSVNTRDDKPFIEKKPVVLCRSGIMLYTKDEAMRMASLNRTKSVKDVYKVYRPKSVIIGSMGLMKDLPIVVEHPMEDVNPSNWSRLAKGYTTSDLEIVPLDDGEIGIKSFAVFPTHELYNYYLQGNEDVSLGYDARYVAVENPDEVGYDIIMTEIASVNHLALTAAGRGGKQVSVLDSLIGGLAQMKTGIFYRLLHKGQTNDGQKKKFSVLVMDAIERSKGKTGDELEKEITSVTDSIAVLKDGPDKELLVGYVHDSFEVPELALKNREELSKVIDSTYDKAEKATMDEDGRGTGTANAQDAKNDGDNDEDDKGGKDDGDDKGAKNVKDSLTLDSIKALLDEHDKALETKITKLVRDSLGIEEDNKAKGGAASSTNDSTIEKLALESIDVGSYL